MKGDSFGIQVSEDLREDVVQHTDTTSCPWRRDRTSNGSEENEGKLSMDTNKWQVKGEGNI